MRGDSLDEEWAELLAAWAIPEKLVAAAPASPYFFDPAVFIAAADEAAARVEDTVSDRMARDALPAGGSVLDVGAGAGAASIRLRAGRVIAVDSNRELLDAFAAGTRVRGATAVTVEGPWPAAAHDTPTADVAVCHHVIYNVPRLAEFITALADHARHRVVLEFTVEHPMAWLRPYWQAVHGLGQPDRPVADDALAVIRGLGFDVHQERWSRAYQMIGESTDRQLGRIARRLCLPPDRYDDLRAAIAENPPPRQRAVVTAWWDLDRAQ
jgi:SAM-dependent methyltransferase